MENVLNRFYHAAATAPDGRIVHVEIASLEQMDAIFGDPITYWGGAFVWAEIPGTDIQENYCDLDIAIGEDGLEDACTNDGCEDPEPPMELWDAYQDALHEVAWAAAEALKAKGYFDECGEA